MQNIHLETQERKSFLGFPAGSLHKLKENRKTQSLKKKHHSCKAAHPIRSPKQPPSAQPDGFNFRDWMCCFHNSMRVEDCPSAMRSQAPWEGRYLTFPGILPMHLAVHCGDQRGGWGYSATWMHSYHTHTHVPQSQFCAKITHIWP